MRPTRDPMPYIADEREANAVLKDYDARVGELEDHLADAQRTAAQAVARVRELEGERNGYLDAENAASHRCKYPGWCGEKGGDICLGAVRYEECVSAHMGSEPCFCSRECAEAHRIGGDDALLPRARALIAELEAEVARLTASAAGREANRG